MKRLLVLLMTAACALCLAFGLAGCKVGENSGGEHVHNYGEIIPEKPATCTEEGLEAHLYCEGCQKYFDINKNETTLDELRIDIDPNAHNYGEIVPQVDAQCEIAGTKAYYHCEDCGKYFDDQKIEKQFDELTIPAKNHNYGELIPEQPATCTEEGMQAYYHCEDCGKYFNSNQVETDYEDLKINVDSTAHNYGELVPQVDAQCEVAGTKAYYHCDNCGKYFDDQKVEKQFDELTIPAKNHNYGELIPEQPATCTDEGLQAYYHCEDCGKYFNSSQVETDYEDLKIDVNPNAHKWDSTGKKCLKCQYERAYTTNPAETKIYFGEYPQSEVEESGLKATLSWEAGNGTLPTAENANGWTDYNYYIEGEVQSFMWYIDVEYENNRYRGVYFTSYRPYFTGDSSSTGNSNQDDNGYKTGTVYWFKYEPIEWRILEQKDGTALLMSNIILDSRQYYHEYSGTRTIDGTTVYPNNYKESDIRAWLNDNFYNTAFDELAKSIIQQTEVDNSASSTQTLLDNQCACENTNDNIFLLSYKDITNSSYGFSSSSSTYDTARQLKSTAYAKSQGVDVNTDSSYRGNGWWWLRSPSADYDYSGYASYVFYNGHGSYYFNVHLTYGGVVPALWIEL